MAESREIAELQARVAELEAELREQGSRTAATVAEAQEKLYWYERWNIDLDRVMARRGARMAFETIRRTRAGVRTAARATRRLLGP